MRNSLLAGAILAVASFGTAFADPVSYTTTLSFTAQSAAGANTAPFTLLNLDNIPQTPSLTPPLVSTSTIHAYDETITFNPDSTQPYSGVYNGGSGVASDPYGPYYGTNLPGHNFIAAESGDPVTIHFDQTQTSFGLLWGSVDSYNTLEVGFYLDGIWLATGTVSGQDVVDKIGSSGNAFVTISNSSIMCSSGCSGSLSGEGFNEIRISSTQPAFEFVPEQVPEPASLALLGVGLLGTGLVARRRRTV